MYVLGLMMVVYSFIIRYLRVLFSYNCGGVLVLLNARARDY